MFVMNDSPQDLRFQLILGAENIKENSLLSSDEIGELFCIHEIGF